MAKEKIKKVIRHQTRKGNIKFKVVWRDLEELGEMWEEPSDLIRCKSTKALKQYIITRKPKSQRAIFQACERLYKLFEKREQSKTATQRPKQLMLEPNKIEQGTSTSEMKGTKEQIGAKRLKDREEQSAEEVNEREGSLRPERTNESAVSTERPARTEAGQKRGGTHQR